MPGFTAYHGSPVGDLSAVRLSERGALGPAAYFTPYQNTAQRYAGPEGHMYEAKLGGVFNGLGAMGDSSVNPYEVWRQQTAKLLASTPPELREQVAEIAAKMGPQDGYPFYKRLLPLFGSDEATQAVFRRAGYGGVSGWADGPEIAMFSETPVKRWVGR